MAKLIFRHGVMGAGKTQGLIDEVKQCRSQSIQTRVFTSGIDTRSTVDSVQSRSGDTYPAIPVQPDQLISKILKEKDLSPEIIFVDEIQFFTQKQVLDLTYIVDTLEIPVIGFGLKSDFQNNLFEGSQAMIVFADVLDEIEKRCDFCERKALLHLRLSHVDSNEVVTLGQQIEVGGDELYRSVCRPCYTKHTKGD